MSMHDLQNMSGIGLGGPLILNLDDNPNEDGEIIGSEDQMSLEELRKR